MKSAVIVLCALVALVAASQEATPVEKVVKLLKDLKAVTVTEGASEDKVYNKYACWCETTTKQKALDINKASTELRKLGQQILKYKGKVASLDSEIQDIVAQLVVNGEQQQTATDLRTRRNGLYQSMQAETKETLEALERAIAVLQQGTSLVQADTSTQLSAVQSVLDKLPEEASINNDHLVFLSEFMQHGASGAYAPQSGTIQGILTDMYAEFAANLEKATMAEAKQNKNYETVINSAKEGASNAKTLKAKKAAQKAEASVDLADTTAVYDSTSDQMKANIAFFDETKTACTTKHTEYGLRSSARVAEAAGIDKALLLLTSDAARQLFADAITPGAATSFLQTASDQTLAVTSSVYNMLKAQATKGKNLRMAMLAVRVRTAKAGHFDVVIESIDAMIGTLNREGASDRTKKDLCATQYQTIATKKGEISWKIENNEAKVEKLNSDIALRQEERLEADTQKNASIAFRAKISQDRIDENRAFTTAKGNDEGAIVLLQQAEAALKQFYDDNDIKMGETMLIQTGQPHAKLSSAGNNKQGSKAIMSLLQYIVGDLQGEIVSDAKAEAASQVAYVEATTTATELEEDLADKISDLDTIISDKGGEKTTELQSFNTNTANLTAVTNYTATIKTDCDWVNENFAGRATSRKAEVDGLVSAKQMLAGQTALLQVPKAPEAKPVASNDKLANIQFLGIRSFI